MIRLTINASAGNGIRDIHLGNIMIREETYYASPTVLSGDQLVIIDFGESRTLDTMDESCESYGAEDYRAPELGPRAHESKASDIYAIGCAMSEMLKIRYKLKLKVGDELKAVGDTPVPTPLLDAIGFCLREEPEDRPTAGQLEDMLRKVSFTESEESGLLTVDLTMGSGRLSEMSWFTG